jgi:PncC family amidohydrolase
MEPGYGEAQKSALELASDLSRMGLMLATAESCTGGLIGSVLTEIPGSSAFYLGGVISYANTAKIKLLQVESATLEREGAVSEATAKQMALGVRRALDADLSVSVTGIAGPGGGSASKPVGTVWIGISSERGERAGHHRFDGTRAAVRAASVTTALSMLREELLALDAGESRP